MRTPVLGSRPQSAEARVRIADFDYELPAERIAQEPLAKRDESRLLVLDRDSGAVQHRQFRNLVEILESGDLVVLNDTRVLAARLVAQKPSGGRVELLLTERLAAEVPETWRCLMRASRKPGVGAVLDLGSGASATVLRRDPEGWAVRLERGRDSALEILDRLGSPPLPPYIRRRPGVDDARDREAYQTVYAVRPGAVAAPTAGLHFTEDLLFALERAGVKRATLTLHVGPGTFLPVRTEHVERHRMQREWFDVPPETADAIEDARRSGRRIVAVGTTVARALESSVAEDPACAVQAGSGFTELFIRPGFRFRVVDTLITNFHLPRSTLLMLVGAFAGPERVLRAYRGAIEAGYRFYSYGDAMLAGRFR